MILLWGQTDPSLGHVRRALEELDARVLFLDQERLPDVHVDVTYAPEARGTLELDGSAYALEGFRSIYLRPSDFRELSSFRSEAFEGPHWRHAAAVQDTLWSYVDVADALVLNRPSAMLSNTSKPLQSRVIRAHGFEVPETLLTTEPTAARAFAAAQGRVVYKSMSGIRSVVRLLDDADTSRLDDVRWCPTQFQRWIEGVDHRVHVVGSEVFSTCIHSNAVDYRYGPARAQPCELPRAVADRCLALACTLDLPVAGLDLRRTPDGRWFCFEVNPAPGFAAYGGAVGREIGRAIARLLLHG